MNKTKKNISHPESASWRAKDPVGIQNAVGILRGGHLRMTIPIIGIFLIIFLVVIIFLWTKQGKGLSVMQLASTELKQQTQSINPLSIEYMRKQQYLGSDITIEETLSPGSNYQRYIASYKSEGLKIYALLTIPNGEKPPRRR